MPRIPEQRPIPEHTPIVVCPRCARHTVHTMTQEGVYSCQVCRTGHPLAPLRKLREEPEGLWCPSATCRRVAGTNFWAAVGGRRMCRACLGWVEVAVGES